MRCGWVLTDFAKLKKLFVSPVTMLEEPENGRFPNQATANENQDLLLCMEEWQLLSPEWSRARVSLGKMRKMEGMGGIKLT